MTQYPSASWKCFPAKPMRSEQEGEADNPMGPGNADAPKNVQVNRSSDNMNERMMDTSNDPPAFCLTSLWQRLRGARFRSGPQTMAKATSLFWQLCAQVKNKT